MPSGESIKDITLCGMHTVQFRGKNLKFLNKTFKTWMIKNKGENKDKK